jgi:hypothetical protein
MPNYPMGFIPLKDERSRMYQGRTLATLPTQNVFHWLPPKAKRLDQTLGSCTCASTAQVRNSHPNHQPGEAFKTIHDVEDQQTGLYHWVTNHDPFQGAYPPDDTGSSVLTAGKGAVHFGWATNYNWYFGLDQVIAGLPFGPIVFGTDWTEDMFTPNRHGFIEPTGDSAGGHAYEIYGMNVRERWFGVLNSWAGWGIQGSQRAKLSFTHADQLLRRDGEAMALVV